jgi:putative spermidine/putrescine transport system substrate-binding protein
MMRLFAALLAAVILGAGSPALARDLTVVAGGGALQDHMRRILFEPFARANNIRVQDVAYDYNVGPIRAMVQANNVTWDVVMVEAPDLKQGCDDGLFERIDWSVVPRDRFLAGGTTECGAGALGWGVAVVFDRDRNRQGPSTFAEFWDVERFPGRRAMRQGARMTLEIALLSDGVPPAQVYQVLGTPEGQRRAFARLDQLRPHLMFWRGGQQPFDWVGSGEVAYAVGFTGRAVNAIRAGRPLEIRWDTLLYAYDFWAVPRGSSNRALAMRMIAHLTSEAGLREMTTVWPINPVTAAVVRDPAVRAANPLMLTNFVDRGVQISTEFWLDNGTDLEQRFTAWLNR